MAIITYPLNGIDYDAENAETYLCTRTSGVYSADENFQASVTGDRQVSISKGLAWIQNADFAGKSVCNTESVAVEIPIADGTRPRIDRIVLRFDKAANASSIVLKQGTPSSTPAAPAVERTELVYELGLCTVRVPAASTIVNAGDVTSTLLDETVCGLMRDGVTGIPTAQLQEQVSDLIDNLRDVIAGVEAGSEVMLKATYGGSEDGVVKSTDKLQTARKIGLANFDGTADITVDQIGAMPKTGGSFSGPVSVNGNFSALGVTRFFSPSYPNLGLTAVGDTDGGIYLGVCDADGAYKTFGVNAKLNAAGKVSIRYKGGGGSSSGSSCRFAFGSKVLTPAEGSYASTLFTSNSLNSLFNTSGEAFSHYNTAVFGVNADYQYNDLRFFIACGTDIDADTWVIRGQSTTQTLPNKPVRVNYLVVTWL